MSGLPQLENGYTRIANELLEAIVGAGLNARQWAVLMAVIRKTYGFNKKTDDIGLSQLAVMTGIAKSHVSVAVRELEARQILIRCPGTHSHSLGVNKAFGEWVELSRVTKSVTPSGVTESVTGGYQIGTKRVTESVTKGLPIRSPQKKDLKTVKTTPKEKGKVSLDEFLKTAASQGQKAISEYQPVWDYSDRVGIPKPYIHLAWREFKERYSAGGYLESKLQVDWRRHFLNAVKSNWYKLWYFDRETGACALTTAGEQASRAAE